GGEGGALRRDDVLDTAYETRNQIELAFADDGKPGVEQRAFGFVEAEEHFALGENGRLGRVDVFGRFFVAGQNAAAEANHPALLVADRKYEPAAETVVVMLAAFLAQNQSGLFDEGEVVVLAFGPVVGVVPSIRRVAETKEFHRFRRHAAFRQIIAGDLATGFIEQRVLPALRDLLVELEQLVLDVARLLFAGGLIEFQRNFRALGQPADGVHKPDVFVFLDEGEHVAALVAAEAVKNLAM